MIGRYNRVELTTMKAAFKWDDAFLFDDQLSDEERAVRDAAHAYCQERLQPRVLMAARHEIFDRAIMDELGELGMLGSTIDGYGCPGVNHVSYGTSRVRSNASTAAIAAR